jgi:hypothetical protein
VSGMGHGILLSVFPPASGDVAFTLPHLGFGQRGYDRNGPSHDVRRQTGIELGHAVFRRYRTRSGSRGKLLPAAHNAGESGAPSSGSTGRRRHLRPRSSTTNTHIRIVLHRRFPAVSGEGVG